MKTGTLGLLAVSALVAALATSAALSRGPGNPTPAPSEPAKPEMPVQAGESAARPTNLQQLLAMFNTNDNAFKVRTINSVLKLTPEEARKFWPVYQAYEKQEQSQTDRRIALIKTFVALSNENKINNENAAKLSGEWLQLEADRVELWKKYYQEMAGAVSPLRAAQFLQVEHQLSLLMDLNIASAMPAVKGAN